MKRLSLGLFKPAAGLLALALVFSACKKDKVNNDRIPAAGVMAFNLAPDRTVGFTVDNSSITTFPLAYTNYTGSYLAVYPGQRLIRSFDGTNALTLATSTATFNDSAYYSLFAIGANGVYKNVVVQDKVEPLMANGKAYVRFINAITDSTASPLVTISSGGSTIVNTNAAYGTVSEFTEINAGDIVVSANAGTEINTTRTINVSGNNIYTILLIGDPASSDPAQAVQVKFINNGTVD